MYIDSAGAVDCNRKFWVAQARLGGARRAGVVSGEPLCCIVSLRSRLPCESGVGARRAGRTLSDDLPTLSLTNHNRNPASPPRRQSPKPLSIVTIHSIWTCRGISDSATVRRPHRRPSVRGSKFEPPRKSALEKSGYLIGRERADCVTESAGDWIAELHKSPASETCPRVGYKPLLDSAPFLHRLPTYRLPLPFIPLSPNPTPSPASIFFFYHARPCRRRHPRVGAQPLLGIARPMRRLGP